MILDGTTLYNLTIPKQAEMVKRLTVLFSFDILKKEGETGAIMLKSQKNKKLAITFFVIALIAALTIFGLSIIKTWIFNQAEHFVTFAGQELLAANAFYRRLKRTRESSLILRSRKWQYV